MSVDRVPIRPDVSVLSVFRALNYKAWYAIAEFVDNSIQSFETSKSWLAAAERYRPRLHVSITHERGPNGDRLVIRDNAGGIARSQFPRAFRPADRPLDTSGLSEFGMGMKSAACWFSPYWYVRTTSIGDPRVYRVTFDVEHIVSARLEELDVTTESGDPSWHFTEIYLESLYDRLHSKTLAKIREHLADIYRMFLKSGDVAITFNDSPIEPMSREYLVAPFFRTPNETPRHWKKEIDLQLGDGVRVHGEVGQLARASTTGAGLVLYRRNRAILGTGEEGYRPKELFGHPNTYRYQRLYGELHVEGLKVSHTKDGFIWETHEQALIEALRSELETEEFPLLSQIDGYRAKQQTRDIRPLANRALDRTADDLERHAADVVSVLGSREPEASIGLAADDSEPSEAVGHAEGEMIVGFRELLMRLPQECWRIRITLKNVSPADPWLSIVERPALTNGQEERFIHIAVSLAHPFMVRFSSPRMDELEPVLRLAACTAVAEVVARQKGVQFAQEVRAGINELLRAIVDEVQ